MNISEHNRQAWNGYVNDKNRWTIPVSAEEIEAARKGIWDIILTPMKPVPHEWFPDLKGLKILGLASGGGQQGPILAALGADVTIFDISENQLDQDRKTSEKFNLNIRTVQGDVKDLSVFEDNSFDLIFNPCSLVFVENLQPVWKECYRILKPGGIILTGQMNPVALQIDNDDSFFELLYHQPYSDLHSLPKEKLEELIQRQEALVFGHSLTDLIGGQLKAGFVITDFYEDVWDGEILIDQYLPSFFATRAMKGEYNSSEKHI